MKYTFQDILIGDMFNTPIARWVKVSPFKAICVMSAIFPLGEIKEIDLDYPVVLLYSTVLRSDDN